MSTKACVACIWEIVNLSKMVLSNAGFDELAEALEGSIEEIECDRDKLQDEVDELKNKQWHIVNSIVNDQGEGNGPT